MRDDSRKPVFSEKVEATTCRPKMPSSRSTSQAGRSAGTGPMGTRMTDESVRISISLNRGGNKALDRIKERPPAGDFGGEDITRFRSEITKLATASPGRRGSVTRHRPGPDAGEGGWAWPNTRWRGCRRVLRFPRPGAAGSQAAPSPRRLPAPAGQCCKSGRGPARSRPAPPARLQTPRRGRSIPFTLKPMDAFLMRGTPRSDGKAHHRQAA